MTTRTKTKLTDRLRHATCVALLLAGLASTAHAGYVLQPTAASTDMGTFFGTSADNTRNQSGLSTGYTSLGTDFDSYIASNPTHDSQIFSFSNIWVSQDNTTTGNFDFDLGGTYGIGSFALWNAAGNGNIGVQTFDLLADVDNTFSSPILLGSFTAVQVTDPANAVLPEVFTFPTTTATFVRMVITSNYANPTNTMFGEAAFEAPEPGTFTLAAFAVLGLGALARRKKSRRRGLRLEA